MKPLTFLLFLLLAFLIVPARHHARVRPGRARPLVRLQRSPQAPKVVRRVAGSPGSGGGAGTAR